MREAFDRSRGGYGTEACVIVDGGGGALGSALAAGQAHERPLAPGMVDSPPGVPAWTVGDRGYASRAFRQQVWTSGSRSAIPHKRNEAPAACPAQIYNNRNVVERFWAGMKERRAIATRHEKTANSSMGVPCLAAIHDWLKR
jgi:transposase